MTSIESVASRGWKRRTAPRAVTRARRIERRISPLVSAAMAHSRNAARKRKKFRFTERMAAATSSSSAIAAVNNRSRSVFAVSTFITAT